jgi:16S rRNA processing protein RimM
VKELVAIARVVRPRGLRGEVVADILTDFPERFEGLVGVTGLLNGESLELKIEDHWLQKDRIVLKFAGCNSIDDAERLRGAEICVAEAEAVDLSDDEYFDWQLVGCSVISVAGETLGIVTGLMRTGGTEILSVQGTDKEFLIPFAGSICVEVDIVGKTIRVDPPEGLLEF